MSVFSGVVNIGKNLVGNAVKTVTQNPFTTIKEAIANYLKSAKDLRGGGLFGTVLSAMPGAVMVNHVLGLAKDAAPAKAE